MPTANEALRDATISHQVDLAQYTAHVLRRMVGVLNRSDADLMAALSDALWQSEPLDLVELIPSLDGWITEG